MCRTVFNGYQGTALQKWVRPFSSDSGMIPLAGNFPFCQVILVFFPQNLEHKWLHNCNINIWIKMLIVVLILILMNRVAQLDLLFTVTVTCISMLFNSAVSGICDCRGCRGSCCATHGWINHRWNPSHLSEEYAFLCIIFFLLISFQCMHVSYISIICACCSCRTWW